MSGHSKWNNIKRKKGEADAHKGKVFTKLGREIQMAVKSGGADPVVNTSLRDIIAKAKSNNMPNDSINRSIQKAAGAGAENFEVIMYEGYGPQGVAVMLRCLSDNRNRTAGDLRWLFDRNGGNLGTSGCVAYLFQEKGSLVLDKEEYDDEEAVMLAALEAGAEDVLSDESSITLLTAPEDYASVREKLEGQKYSFVDMSLGPVPLNYINLANPEAVIQMEKLLDALDDNDDVSEYWHNWDMESSV